MSAAGKVALLDRDGTIIVEKGYLADPAGVELLPGAAAGLAAMQQAGWRLVVVTNQSGVGRGYYSYADMEAVNARLVEVLAAAGVSLAGVYACPHAPDAGCACRKPKAGMVEQAARELGFAPAEAVVIGDKLLDMELAATIGAQGILVRTGYGAQVALPEAPAFRVAADLAEAARLLGAG